MIIENKNVTPGDCPVCFYRVDSASCVTDEGAQPKPGDLTVCFRCAAPLKFVERHQLETLSEEETIQAMSIPEFARVVRLIKTRACKIAIIFSGAMR